MGQVQEHVSPHEEKHLPLGFLFLEMPERIDRVTDAAAIDLVPAHRKGRVARRGQLQHFDPCGPPASAPIPAYAAARRPAETIPHPAGIAPGTPPPGADARNEPDRRCRRKCRVAWLMRIGNQGRAAVENYPVHYSYLSMDSPAFWPMSDSLLRELRKTSFSIAGGVTKPRTQPLGYFQGRRITLGGHFGRHSF